MERRTWRLTALILICQLICQTAFAQPVFADELEDEIANRRATIETINRQLEEYRKKINEYSSKGDSLANELVLLENETAMLELDVAATRNEIEATQLELESLDGRIEEADVELERRREVLKNLLFALYAQNGTQQPMVAMLASDNFAEVFRASVHLQNVNDEVHKALAATQLLRQNLEKDRSTRQQTLDQLTVMELDLEKKIQALAAQQQAKEVLLRQTASSESEYRSLVSDLQREQQSINARINELQRTIDRRLQENGGNGDALPPASITWPLRGTITTLFHDPTYPFRNLFEHSGLDIATPQGSAIGAAAPGIVAWAKTGRMYGNYVMIIHAGGMATLYAHMSRMDVAQDQYVERGEVIGLSGGRPGTSGAGFSTGPHLHFEVRKDGIPVDPMRYLP